MSNPILEAIENVQKSFHDLQETNAKMIAEEAAGNAARANELRQALDKISEELSEHQKQRAVAEKRQATMAERLEIVEAVNDRPGKTVADKMRDKHKELFLKWYRSKGTDRNAEEQMQELQVKAREMKDVAIGVGADGGFALPNELSRSVDALLLKLSPIVDFVSNVQVGSSDYNELVSINGSTSAWAGETTSRTGTVEPTLRKITPTWGELYAYVKASNWSIEDIFFNVEQFLVDNIAEGFSVALSQAIYDGNGSNKPTGFVNATPTTGDDYASPMRAAGAFEYIPLTSPSSPITSSGVTAKSLIDLVYLLNQRYRGNARFAMNTVTQGHVRKMTDTNGQFLWQPSLIVGQPDTLLGYPIFTWEHLGNPTTANAFPVAFGDFKKAYTLATRSGMQIVRENVTAPGFTNFYIARRFGGKVRNNDAVKLLKVSAS